MKTPLRRMATAPLRTLRTIWPTTHQYGSCTYSSRYRGWVKTCRTCGQVVWC